MPLTRKDLDAEGCDNPDCQHDHTVLHWHAVCHPQAKFNVSYDKRTGCLTATCGVCEQPIGEIEVAP